MSTLRRATFAVLVAASLLHLPIVHRLVGHDQAPPPAAITVGLLSMGLAWSAGCSLENRRRGTVRGIAAAGLAVPLLVFLLGDALGLTFREHLYAAASGAFCAIGLALLFRTPPLPAPPGAARKGLFRPFHRGP